MIALLERRFRCIAFDFPGYGLSDKPAGYSYSLFQQADPLEALVTALGVRAARMVCHDLGTSVVCELLARKDEGRLGFELEHVTFTNGSMLQWRADITPFQKLLAANETLLTAMEVCARIPDGFVTELRGLTRRPDAISSEDEVVMRERYVRPDEHRLRAALAQLVSAVRTVHAAGPALRHQPALIGGMKGLIRCFGHTRSVRLRRGCSVSASDAST